MPMHRARNVTACLGLALGLLAGAARAQPSAADPRAVRIDDVTQAFVLAETSDRMMRARRVRPSTPDPGASTDADLVEAREAAWQRLRVYARLAAPTDIPAALSDELRRHARRVAELDRLRTLAERAARMDLVVRVDALAAREDAVHARRLATLTGRLDPPAAAPPAAPRGGAR